MGEYCSDLTEAELAWHNSGAPTKSVERKPDIAKKEIKASEMRMAEKLATSELVKVEFLNGPRSKDSVILKTEDLLEKLGVKSFKADAFGIQHYSKLEGSALNLKARDLNMEVVYRIELVEFEGVSMEDGEETVIGFITTKLLASRMHWPKHIKIKTTDI